jgi:adenylate cyclase
LSDASPRAPDDGVWDRLRRRKVVQWSVAYVAAAWALLQGLEFLADLYDWPTAFLRVVTLVLAVGLPIVVTLAWYHGDRGEQRIGGTELSIVAVLFLLGGGVVWYYSAAPTPRRPALRRQRLRSQSRPIHRSPCSPSST